MLETAARTDKRAGVGWGEGADESGIATAARSLAGEEILLPVQFFGDPMLVRRSSGLHRLMLAVFDQALRDFYQWRHREEVRRWLGSKHGPFSFGAICEAFGWEVEWLRPRVRGWMREVEAGRGRKLMRRSHSSRRCSPRLPRSRDRRERRRRTEAKGQRESKQKRLFGGFVKRNPI
ncbi:MAG TPA: hypothetical protein VKS22_16220 [Candidatus Binataceae bacterium]|nr:hypothetical protein [Candidatus Binataceae bacterium]